MSVKGWESLLKLHCFYQVEARKADEEHAVIRKKNNTPTKKTADYGKDLGFLGMGVSFGNGDFIKKLVDLKEKHRYMSLFFLIGF